MTIVNFSSMVSSTIENYVKQIYLTAEKLGVEVVPMGMVAQSLGVVPGTATTMIKAMDRQGLAIYEPRQGVKLSPRGRQLALQIVRRHRLIEYFLVDVLQMDWSEIHEEAEELEHAISERLLERIDKFLGEPRFDPHGDPIPTADGRVIQPTLTNLTQCHKGDRVVISRISDQAEGFLNYAQEKGLKPGVTLKILSIEAEADCITLQIKNGAPLNLGRRAAEKILVVAPSSTSTEE